jgi:RimJ/RimL family protein N-acetyltransferase
MDPLLTERLRLVPATAALIRLELTDPTAFFRALGTRTAEAWPAEALRAALPEFLRRLEADPSAGGWLTWYWILRRGHVLVGGGGFKGRPDADGKAEIGFETRPAYRRQGYATEAVGALARWALNHEGVRSVVAEIDPENSGSRAVLLRTGFGPTGLAKEPGLLRFERRESRRRTS